MSILTHIQQIETQIHQTEAQCHRPQGSVQLLAVSKQRTPEEINEAFHAGVTRFGENYLQEALIKIKALTHLPIEWHYIGAIQSNKTKAIAENFDWVQTVASAEIAKRLNKARSESLLPLNVCIQVNIDQEESKAGVDRDSIMPLAHQILASPNLRLRGLMAIPKPEVNISKQRRSFQRLTTIFTTLNQEINNTMDTLSMGMSSDFRAAILEGSTLVRIGTALFGSRPYKS